MNCNTCKGELENECTSCKTKDEILTSNYKCNCTPGKCRDEEGSCINECTFTGITMDTLSDE